MIFQHRGDWQVSDCGFYRIQKIGSRQRGAYRLQVQLIDGWIEYPTTFALMRDARVTAADLEK